MEEKKKKKRLPIFILLGLLLICAVFSGLLITGVLKVPTVGGQKVDVQTAALIKKASNVSDEMTLRELLLLELELDITVTKDIETDETFLVRGTKTLYGDAMLSMDAAGKFKELYVLEVQKNAKLTMDGLTLSGNGMGSGVQVNQRAELVYQSGDMVNICKGIYTNGKVTIHDVNMKNISYAGIYSSFKSNVFINGGTYYNGGRNFVNVTTGGNVQIDGGTFQLATGTAITNAGTLVVHDATISEITGNAIYNSGKFTAEYRGEKENGYIEIKDNVAAALSIYSSRDTEISDIHVNGSGTNCLYVGEILEGCKVIIDNCVFENSKGNTISTVGNVTIKNTAILDSGKDAIYSREGGKLKLENITIKNPKERGIRVLGSTLTAEKVEIVEAGTMSISVNPTKSLPGKATLSEIHISGAKGNNLYMNGETEVYIKDSVLEKSKTVNVAVTTGTLTMENVQVLGNLDEKRYALSLGKEATVTMTGDSLITGTTRRGVNIGENATFNMLGGSICNITSSSAAAVYVTNYATFNMKGGEIYGNYAKSSSGAVTVQGVMNMSGGTIRNNESGSSAGGINIGYDTSKGTKGVFNMTGGSIKNNTAATSGGGIHVSSGVTANLSGGNVTGNTANGNYNSNGILNNGEVTIKGSFYMGEDKMYLNRTAVVVKIKGNTLKKHSASKPLLIVPCQSTKEGTKVVECDSNGAVVSLLNNYVTSGVRSFTLCQKENMMTVTHNAADMDMTGADTIHVKNFAELKEAVRTTRSKRYIVVCADIEMESALTVPNGTTIYIRDDGVTRTLSRKDGQSSEFFNAYYGTGLYLAGTSSDRLVLNGEHSSDVKGKSLKSLVHVYGSTVIENAVFENNGTAQSTFAGAFIYQSAGDLTVSASTFKNGTTSKSGGAIYLTAGSADIKDSVFADNEAGASAGAIRAQASGNVDLKVENTTFLNNKSVGNGAAINQCGGTLTVINSTFAGNISEANGGSVALTEHSEGTFVGTDETKAVVKNSKASAGGAIYLNNGKLNASGYIFEENTAKNGGVIYQDKKNTEVTLTDTILSNNTATSHGGAVYVSGQPFSASNCEFGDNVTKTQGGAIYIKAGSDVSVSKSTFTENETTQASGGAIYTIGNLTLTETIFSDNKAGSVAGAINCDGGTLTATSCIFTGNAAGEDANAGAVSVTGKSVATFDGNGKFEGNTASNGGAIYTNNATLKISGYTFDGNSAKYGGAIYSNKQGETLTVKDSTFINNQATYRYGGAIYSSRNLEVISCAFGEVGQDGISGSKGNTSASQGGAFWLASGTEVSIKTSQFAGNESGASGGAIYNNATLTLEETDFIDNTASSVAGAINCDGGTLTATSCIFTGNAAGKDANAGAVSVTGKSIATFDGNGKFEGNTASNGGAIYTNNATLKISGYTFDGNSAKYGGAIYSNKQGETLTVKDSTFINNQATYRYGGAIYSLRNLEVISCAFGEVGQDGISGSKGNTSTSQGGAFWLASGTEVSIKTSQFAGNESGASGGAIYNNATLTLEETDFIDNNAASSAGAINCDITGQLTATKCDFTNNHANGGNSGAIGVTGSTDKEVNASAFIEGGTFSLNSASSNGGVIYTNNGDLTIKNAVLSENTAKKGGALYINYQHVGTAEDIVLEGLSFSKNEATSEDGGTIYNRTRKVVATGCTFETDDEGTFVNERNGKAEITGDMTGATFVYTQKAASVVIGSAGITSDITITPSDYSTDYEVVGGVNATVKDKIKVTPNEGTEYTIKENGRLRIAGALPVATIGETLYDTLSEALEVAKEVTNTTTDNPVVITVLQDTTVSATETISNHVKLTTASDSNVTISRGKDVILFDIAEGGSLYIDGKITLDGNKDIVTGTTNFITNAGIFTLGKDAAVKNVVNTKLRAIYSTAGTVNLYGTLSGNETGTGVKAAAVRIMAGTLNVDGATFENNSGGFGSAIYVDAGTLNVDGATFTGNSGKYGGAIFLCAGVNATIQGSSFSENNSTDTSTGGGAIYSESTEFTLKGCTFADNTAESTGTAVYNNGGTVDVSDCTFTNETFANAKDGGNAVVSGALTGVNFVYKVKNASVVIGDAGITSDITITPKSYETDYSVVGGAVADAKSKIKVTPNDGVEYTITEDGKLEVVVENKVAKIGDTSYNTLSEALAAAKLVENTTVDNPVVITVLQNTELSATESITNHVKLTTASDSNVTISRGADITLFDIAEGGSLCIDGVITLDGNKDVVTGTKNVITNAGTFTLGKDAAIKNIVNTSFRAIYSTAGTVNLYGTLSGNKTGSGVKAAAVRIYAGTLNVDGATFENNSGGFGSAIYVDAGTLNVDGATFKNNSGSQGGAIYVCAGVSATIQNSSFSNNDSTDSGTGGGAIFSASTAFTLKECTFTGNTAPTSGSAVYNNGGTVNVSDCTFTDETFANAQKAGKTVITGTMTRVTFVYKYNAANVIIGEGGLRGGSDVAVQLHANCAVGGAVLGKAEKTTADQLARAAEIIQVVQEDNYTAETWKYIDAEGKLAQGIEDGAVSVTTVDELKTAIAKATDAATIYVMNDITISETIEISTNITLKSLSTGVKIIRGADVVMLDILEGGSLSVGGAIALDGNGGSIDATQNFIRNNGTSFTLGPNATIQNVKASVKERRAIHSNTGTVNLYGVLSDNQSVGQGAAVKIAAGTLNVDGATFANNKSKQGGAIYLDAGTTATIQNASLNGNESTTNGGGAIYSQATMLILTKSTFASNTSKTQGGAVHCAAGEIKATDCTFTSNKATRYGGAIRVDGGATGTVEGGTFSLNEATIGGGAISGNSANLKVKNSTLSENNSVDGGAIYIGSGTEAVTLNNIVFESLVFEKNVATTDGGAIYNVSRTLDITDCTFDQTDEGKNSPVDIYNESGVLNVSEDCEYTTNTTTAQMFLRKFFATVVDALL